MRLVATQRLIPIGKIYFKQHKKRYKNVSFYFIENSFLGPSRLLIVNILGCRLLKFTENVTRILNKYSQTSEILFCLFDAIFT